MKIAIAGSYPEGVVDAFRQALPTGQFEVEAVDTQEKYQSMDDADVIVLRIFKAPREIIERNKNLKMICRWGAGYDSVDIEAAGEHGVLVTNTPGANAHAVSELAVLLMAAVGRNLLSHTESLAKGIWSKTTFTETSVTLYNKTVGLIGGGHIGRQVAAKAQAFGAQVLYYDLYRMPPEEEERHQMRFTEFDTLIKESDVISLHVPLTENNHHLIGPAQFSAMKPSAILINTARGGLVDDSALEKALAQNKIAGAGLDCVEQEPLPKEHPFIQDPRVVITPHIGGGTRDLSDVMVPMIAKNMIALASGEPVEAIVNSQYLSV